MSPLNNYDYTETLFISFFQEIETTIEETTSLHNGHDDEAVYVNTTIGGAARPPSPNEGQDYQNAVLRRFFELFFKRTLKSPSTKNISCGKN